jgi:hypothetical protein
VGFGLILGGAGAANAFPKIPGGGDSFQQECADLIDQSREVVREYYDGPRTPATLQAAGDKLASLSQTYNQIGCAGVYGPYKPASLPAPRRASPVAVQGATGLA